MMTKTETQQFTDEKTKTMVSKLKDVAWLSKLATEHTTPFEQCNLDLLHDTLWKALRAIEDCRETK